MRHSTINNKPKRVKRVRGNVPRDNAVWQFNVNGLTYYIDVEVQTFFQGKPGHRPGDSRYDQLRSFNITFQLDHPEHGTSYHSTGSGNALAVLNTVSDTMFKYLKARSLKRGEVVSFLVDEASKGRELLYKRFAERCADVIGGAKVSFRVDRNGSGGFRIVKS